VLNALFVAPDSMPHFTLSGGVLRYKNKDWIGNNEPLQVQILTALHASTVGGDSGFLVTYRRMKQMFAWKGMKATTLDFVQACQVCQQAKPNLSRYLGLLAPLPVPNV
jgi:hypothetical protein